MTALRPRKLEIEDCEAAILRNRFDWGRGYATDSSEPPWDEADASTRQAVIRRGYALSDGHPARAGFTNHPPSAIMPRAQFIPQIPGVAYHVSPV